MVILAAANCELGRFGGYLKKGVAYKTITLFPVAGAYDIQAVSKLEQRTLINHHVET
jgi:hypothetical protein